MEYDWSWHEDELLYIIIEGMINGKIYREWPKTSYIKRMISDAGLTNYKELKRLADNRDEFWNFEQLQNQPLGWSQKNNNMLYVILIKYK